MASTLPPPPAMPAILKTCACGLAHTEYDIRGLKYVGLQEDGDGGWLVLRNCTCGSTMALEVAS